jgi:hypothetical protein
MRVVVAVEQAQLALMALRPQLVATAAMEPHRLSPDHL